MTESLPPSNEIALSAALEALLFVAPGPVTPAQLAQVLDKTATEVEAGLHELERQFVERGGLALQWYGGRVLLTTSSLTAPLVEKFLGLEATSRLSRAALESLAIVAYQQPITRPQIDAIRGVNSDGVIKSLLSKGLIQEMGRAESPGRPIMYGTTTDFLQYFGLSSLSELPSLEMEALKTEEEPKNLILKD
jgi:segregation and condensation protein B